MTYAQAFLRFPAAMPVSFFPFHFTGSFPANRNTPMSILVNDLYYTHPGGDPLFRGLSFSLPDGAKAALVGDNGSGKSTLLQLLAGRLVPAGGQLSLSAPVFLVPQHFGQYDAMSVAGALGLGERLDALNRILRGEGSPCDFTLLNDDWELEARIRAALAGWELGDLQPDDAFSSLSGGEKTRVFLAGTALCAPKTLLLDEPTNHLDRRGRERLYRFARETSASLLIVSHDRELLGLLDTTFELTSSGIERYGGNYEFYAARREERLNALGDRLAEQEKSLRAARRKARAAAERKQRIDARGERKQKESGVARILMNTIRDGAERSASRLLGNHAAKIGRLEERRQELRLMLPPERALKIAVGGSGLHDGKMLVQGEGVNFGWCPPGMLWREPFDFWLLSGERVALVGGNGSGKTTLLRLLLGQLQPSCGSITRAGFSYVYIDQEYAMIDSSLTVLQQVGRYNARNLPDHRLKTELHRFLFPAPEWDKSCGVLSGGEKMRLLLCCMVVADDAPDLFVLDEPANNLDIRSMEILTGALAGYGGTVLVVSHDQRFLEEIGVTRLIILER